MGTRARIWLTMTLLGYPFFAIGASTCSLAAGEGSTTVPVRTFPRCLLDIRNRAVSGRIVLRITFDQIRGIFLGGIAAVVRLCIRVDSYHEKEPREGRFYGRGESVGMRHGLCVCMHDTRRHFMIPIFQAMVQQWKGE